MFFVYGINISIMSIWTNLHPSIISISDLIYAVAVAFFYVVGHNNFSILRLLLPEGTDNCRGTNLNIRMWKSGH